jgi:hypothetical protein
MKRLLILVFTLGSGILQAQTEKIESVALDNLIWKKINVYRSLKGTTPFIAFEDSLMRAFCTRLAHRNIEIYPPLHSDSVGYWSNAECLYSYKYSGANFNNLVNEIRSGNVESFAERAVQSWIHSPTHERAISRPEYNIATVVSIIVIDYDNKTIRFESTYHALDKEHNTFNGYVYHIKKGK